MPFKKSPEKVAEFGSFSAYSFLIFLGPSFNPAHLSLFWPFDTPSNSNSFRLYFCLKQTVKTLLNFLTLLL